MSSSLKYAPAGAVDVKSLRIVSIDGKRSYDLGLQVTDISIYEDISYPVVTADIFIVDSIDLLYSFPIIGEEKIEIEFALPGYPETATYTLYVKGITNHSQHPQLRYKTYMLEAVSQEFLINANQFMTQKMTGDASFLVQGILQKQLATQKNILVEPTRGIQDLLVSRLRPLQVVDMLRSRAVSKNYYSSSFVFFENRRGFNFVTMEYLGDQLQKNVNDKIFYYDPAIRVDSKNITMRSVISLDQVRQVDNTIKLAQGALHNIVKRFDIITGQSTSVTYRDDTDGNKFKFASKSPIGLNTSSFQLEYGKTPAISLLTPHSSALPENFINTALGPRHSFVSKMDQNIYHAYVPGDTALIAGDVITVNVPAVSGSTGPAETSRLTTGNYIMSKVRHLIKRDDNGSFTYHNSLELIKGFYEDH